MSSPSVELLQRECLMTKSEFPLPKLAFEEETKAAAAAAAAKAEQQPEQPGQGQQEAKPQNPAKPEPLFTKRNEKPSMFSWQETNMGLDELTRTSHVQPNAQAHAVQHAPHTRAQPEATQAATNYPDSLNNNPQESEEKFYDS